jgi:hypothetical protein
MNEPLGVQMKRSAAIGKIDDAAAHAAKVSLRQQLGPNFRPLPVRVTADGAGL